MKPIHSAGLDQTGNERVTGQQQDRHATTVATVGTKD